MWQLLPSLTLAHAQQWVLFLCGWYVRLLSDAVSLQVEVKVPAGLRDKEQTLVISRNF